MGLGVGELPGRVGLVRPNEPRPKLCRGNLARPPLLQIPLQLPPSGWTVLGDADLAQ